MLPSGHVSMTTTLLLTLTIAKRSFSRSTASAGRLALFLAARREFGSSRQSYVGRGWEHRRVAGGFLRPVRQGHELLRRLGGLRVDLLVNDLSLHGQFTDLESFRGSITKVMRIREIARRDGRAVYCHRSFVNGQVTKAARMPEAVGALRLEEQRAVMGWLSQLGPFWDDDRLHDGGDWYECNGDVVTDSAVGEVAHCLLHGIDRGLVSLAPSNFEFDPVAVERVFDDESRKRVDIRNHWEPAKFEIFIAAAPPALASWTVLAECAVSRFTRLTFAGNAFEPLRGQPFKQGVAERVIVLLDVLQRLRQSFDEDGSRTAEGHILYKQHFTGQ